MISFSDYKNLKWKRFENFLFASKDVIVPFAFEELKRASFSMLILFYKEDGNISPVALLGVRKGENLYVSPDGKWLSPYIPAQYRGYPFALASIKEDQMVLYVDRESGLVGENYELEFFDENGEPTKLMRDIIDFLWQVWQSRNRTLEICKIISDVGLMVPWRISLKTDSGEHVIEGLWRIEEESFRKLDTFSLYRLPGKSALGVIYYHFVSLENLTVLKNLADARLKLEREKMLREIDLSFLDKGGLIRFD